MIEYDHIFNLNPKQYVRTYFASKLSELIKSFYFDGQIFNGGNLISMTVVGVKRNGLEVRHNVDNVDKFYKESVEIFGQKGVSYQTMISAIAEVNNAIKIVNEEYQKISQPRILLQNIERLTKYTFTLTYTQDQAEYDLIYTLFQHGAFYFDPKKSVIVSDPNRGIMNNARIHTLFDLNTNWTRSDGWVNEFVSLLNEFIEAKELVKETKYGILLDNYYKIETTELIQYCNLFATDISEKIENAKV